MGRSHVQVWTVVGPTLTLSVQSTDLYSHPRSGYVMFVAFALNDEVVVTSPLSTSTEADTLSIWSSDTLEMVLNVTDSYVLTPKKVAVSSNGEFALMESCTDDQCNAGYRIVRDLTTLEVLWSYYQDGASGSTDVGFSADSYPDSDSNPGLSRCQPLSSAPVSSALLSQGQGSSPPRDDSTRLFVKHPGETITLHE